MDLHADVVVLPGDAEDDLPLGLAQALDSPIVAEFGMPGQHRTERAEHFGDGLVEIGFARVPANDALVESAVRHSRVSASLFSFLS